MTLVWKELMPVILHTNQRIRIDWRKTETKRTFGLEYECVSASACVHSLLLATYNGAEYKDIVLLPNITITSTAHQQNNKDETNETNERANWTSSNSRNVFEDVLLCVFFGVRFYQTSSEIPFTSNVRMYQKNETRFPWTCETNKNGTGEYQL